MKLWEAHMPGEGEDPETSCLWYAKGKNEILTHIRTAEKGSGDNWGEDAEVPYSGELWHLQRIVIGELNFETIRCCLLRRGYVEDTLESYKVVCKNGRIIEMTPQEIS